MMSKDDETPSSASSGTFETLLGAPESDDTPTSVNDIAATLLGFAIALMADEETLEPVRSATVKALKTFCTTIAVIDRVRNDVSPGSLGLSEIFQSQSRLYDALRTLRDTVIAYEVTTSTKISCQVCPCRLRTSSRRLRSSTRQCRTQVSQLVEWKIWNWRLCLPRSQAALDVRSRMKQQASRSPMISAAESIIQLWAYRELHHPIRRLAYRVCSILSLMMQDVPVACATMLVLRVRKCGRKWQVNSEPYSTLSRGRRSREVPYSRRAVPQYDSLHVVLAIQARKSAPRRAPIAFRVTDVPKRGSRRDANHLSA